MICPICGSFTENKKRCQSCGSYINDFSKIYDISNILYNRGLACASVNDFTHAEEALRKSVLFNKNNINARNVLGLVYYETGRISLALEQWVISSNIKKDDNYATQYVEYFQRNPKELQNLNESLKIYNQALRSARQKSEDMAIIQLKKAVDLNPKFITALNLLSFCYMRENDNDKALDIIKRVLAIDSANSEALAYFRELCPDGTRFVESIKIVKTNKAYDEPVKYEPKISRKVRDSRRFRIMETLVFIAGCACTAAVMFVLVFPGISNEKQEIIDKKDLEISELQKKYDEEKIKNDNDKSEELQKENESLKVEIAQYQRQTEERNTLDQLSSASALSVKGDYAGAAETISTINISHLSSDKLEEYNALKEKVYKKQASSLLRQGRTFVNSKKYQEAKEVFEKAILYYDYDELTKYNIMYYFGLSLKELGDKEKAKDYLSQVAANHPQRNYKNLATKQLERL